MDEADWMALNSRLQRPLGLVLIALGIAGISSISNAQMVERNARHYSSCDGDAAGTLSMRYRSRAVFEKHGVRLESRERQLSEELVPGTKLAGFTEAKLKFNIDPTVRTVSMPSGEFRCVVMDALHLSVSYDPMTIFVDDDLLRGSCEYNYVVRHEREHVRIWEEAIRDHVPEIEAELAQALAMGWVIFAPSAEEALDQLGKRTAVAITDVFNRRTEALEEVHAAFDAADNPRVVGRALTQCREASGAAG